MAEDPPSVIHLRQVDESEEGSQLVMDSLLGGSFLVAAEEGHNTQDGKNDQEGTSKTNQENILEANHEEEQEFEEEDEELPSESQQIPNFEESRSREERETQSIVRRANLDEVHQELFYLVCVGKSTTKQLPKELQQVNTPETINVEFTDQEYMQHSRQELDKMRDEKIKEYENKKRLERARIRDNYVKGCLIELVEKQGASFEVVDDQGMTVVHHLSMLGTPECLQWCLAKGAKKDVRGLDGGTPLFWATSCREEECVRVLAEAGANVNTSDDNGTSALYVAAIRMLHIPSVSVLLKYGVTLTEQLLLSASKLPEFPSERNVAAALEILKMFTKYKSDFKFLAKTAEGDNALLSTVKYWIPAFRVLYASYEENIRKKDCLNKKTRETILHYMIRNGDPEKDRYIVVDLIKSKGLTPRWRDENGRSFVHWLIDNPLWIPLMAELQIDINVADDEGNTPLHDCVKNISDSDDRLRVVRLLLSCAINKDVKNKEGKTAVELVGSSPSDQELARIIESHTPAKKERLSALLAGTKITAPNDKDSNNNNNVKQKRDSNVVTIGTKADSHLKKNPPD